jgi:hypothetical protein
LLEGFRGAQCQAAGYGCKLVSSAKALLTEALDEDAADCGHEGTASGEKDAINFTCVNAGFGQEAIDASFDGGEVFFDPRFEFAAFNRNLEIDVGQMRTVFETEFSFFLLR